MRKIKLSQCLKFPFKALSLINKLQIKTFNTIGLNTIFTPENAVEKHFSTTLVILKIPCYI